MPGFFGIGGPMVAVGFKAWWPAEAAVPATSMPQNYRELSWGSAGLLNLAAKETRRPPSSASTMPDFSLWLGAPLRIAASHCHFVQPVDLGLAQANHLKSPAVSHMLCLFPEALYRAAGVPVSYVGHPLAMCFPSH